MTFSFRSNTKAKINFNTESFHRFLGIKWVFEAIMIIELG